MRRGSDTITKLRALIVKTPALAEFVDLSDAMLDVFGLLNTQRATSRAVIMIDASLEPRDVGDAYASPSRREREVMRLVVMGLRNKQVAFELGISEITVRAHRGHVMRKMNAKSLAGLVMMAASISPLIRV